ncbi:SpoIIE family protein phosphatase [Streptomyces naganishii]|uniref:Transcription antitermination regulator n=1 Tax=Streptomyces naganishii JCM 4654 TaxID=1306179 RepID=A0A919CUT0_9ACTN|nr:transcription antitermination regulator [Streptomyces naganishii JCM 4654]
MCDARRVSSEPAVPAEPGAAPDIAALARIVARQRAEMDRLRDLAATSAVLERAKGVLMALTGISPEAAHEELLQRARAAHRTLMEECWLTLGTLVPPLPPGLTEATAESDAPPPTPPGGSGTPDTAKTGRAADTDAAVLAALGPALARVGTPQDLARCLHEHLSKAVGADAVLLYHRQPAGGLELIGHRGVDDTLAAQWRHVPPLSGVAALDALASREALWLEDPEADARRYSLIGAGDRAARWPSRAWLPVVTAGSADVVIGVLRTREGPFTPGARELMCDVAQLCAGRLRAFLTRPEPLAAGTADVLRAAFEALPGISVLLTPLRSPDGEVEDYRIEAATPQTVDAVGRSGRRLVGLRVLECWPAMAEEPLWQGWLGTLTTGEPFEGEPFARQELVSGSQELSTYSVRAARLGDALVVTWLRQDSSDRQQQRLADLQRLGRLGWATWNLVTHEAAWSSHVYALCGRDPARGPVRLEELPDLAVPEDGPALAGAVAELLSEGKPFDVPFRVRTPAGLRHLRAVAESVPDTEGAPAEVHGFLQDLTAQRSAELALFKSEQAVLTQHEMLQAERTLAGRLQHALLPLPRRPVRLAGLHVDLAYLPAQTGIHVGGDWYSAIELPGGDALLVVGDVAGHGLDAVATMAQLRFTAKGMILTGSSLTEALTGLNTLLLHSLDSHGTATMVLARYKPAQRRLIWAQAGHPPPLLLHKGEPRYLERPRGALLGATHTPVFEEAECRLEPGDRLLLYTDGLVERPGEPIEVGLERLAAAASAPATAARGSDASGSLGPLLAAMLPGERRDDVCVLDVRVPSTPG